MQEEIKNILKNGVERQIFPGAVVGLIDNSMTRTIIPVGNFEYDVNSPKVEENTVYDIASITKSIPVGLIALKFIEEGKLDLEEKVSKYIPELKGERAEKGQIKHLLTYTYVLKKNPDPNFSYENQTAKDIFDFLFNRDFEFEPGTQHKYSNTPLNILGIVLEKISGKKLYGLAEEIILGPLKMKRSTFRPKEKNKIPPTEIVPWRGKIQGMVHDETASILQKAGFQPGCAGLFSNIPDILNVLEMLLQNGKFEGKTIFKPETIRLMETNFLGDIREFSGIGWELNEKFFMGEFATEHTIGKTGFTGTCIVLDRDKGKGFVMLSNASFPQRPKSREPIQEIRRSISDVILKP